VLFCCPISPLCYNQCSVSKEQKRPEGLTFRAFLLWQKRAFCGKGTGGIVQQLFCQ
jgi:hypothetical protein